MQRKIIKTADGSTTIQIEEWDEQYHSVHGAIQEANHVFIKQGLLFSCVQKTEIAILEIGFGTGLNALISLIEAERLNLNIDYVGVEAFPVAADELNQLNYVQELHTDADLFSRLHHTSWEVKHEISSYFNLTKQQKQFKEIQQKNQFDLIYFDAFGARVQPELWTEAIFKIMFEALKDQGVLVTYSAKGSVRRAMQTVGFMVERLEGPPGKREMLRAIKHIS